jgi:ubiquinone/menaquinone biosynthesis C-methylase UbiE
MDNKIQSANIYEKKKLDNPDIEYDKTGKTRPAWIKIKNQVKSKFLTISFGYGNINYMEFLHSGFFLPVNYTKEEMKKLYDQFAENYDEVVEGFGDELGARTKVIDLFCKLGKDKSSKILDVGSGTGRGAEVLFEKGYENITLLDLSKKMLEKARKKQALKNCRFVEAEFVEYNTKDKYDVVASFFAFGSLNYFSEEEIRKNIVKINQMLNKGGVFVGVVGNVLPFEKTFKTLFSGEYELKEGLKVTYFIGQRK